MTEAFDPNSYRHEHGPNETCDVCALLAEIQRLSAELKVTRIGWDTTQGMLTWVVGEREADLKREYHKCALFNCRNRALPSFCEVHSDVPRDIIDLLSVAETAFRGGFKPPVWWRDAALRFINGEPRQVCNWYENGAMCNGLPMPGTGRCERHTHEPRTLPEVAGDSLPTTLAQFELRAKHYLADEQAKISPDTALIGLLCDAVRLARENERMGKAGIAVRVSDRSRTGCRDLDPDWPGADGNPRGPRLCVLYPNCDCGHADSNARTTATKEAG
jgi:hypothetical protein